ncbi:MAG: DUF951 domain-containing protein [Armatimonadetes bacterium]|nr:DUF951 domain-containing protein [Armatimonadota bacterium]
MPIYVGDELELKKPHPCGENHWLVMGTGADIRLKCAGCGRRLMVPRSKLEKEIRRFIARGPRAAKETGGADVEG